MDFFFKEQMISFDHLLQIRQNQYFRSFPTFQAAIASHLFQSSRKIMKVTSDMSITVTGTIFKALPIHGVFKDSPITDR